MKKSYILILIVIALTCSLAAGQKFALGVNAGYMMPKESAFEKGPAFGLHLQYNFIKYLGIEVSVLYNQGNVGEGGGSPGKGTLKRIIPGINLVGRIPFGAKLTGVILAEAHYSNNTYSLDSSVKEGLEPFGFIIESSMESGVGYQAGAGLEFLITKKIALQLDGRYMMNKSKGKWSITDEVSGITTEGELEDTNLDGILLNLGVRFYL